MNAWIFASIVLGMCFLSVYGYAVWRYVHGRGRDYVERAVKGLLLISDDEGRLQIKSRKMGVVLEFCRISGAEKEVEIHLRIPRTDLSESHRGELIERFISNGYEVIENGSSIEWVLVVRMFVDDIWEVGSAEMGASAAQLVLDTLGFGKEARFLFALQGKKTWRIVKRGATGGDKTW
jgi:hypothetical protein